MFPFSNPIQTRSGSILIAVLGFVVLLSFIVVAFMEDATNRIKYYGLFYNRDDLRTEAYSAMETTLAVLNEFREIDKALWSPAQGWQNPLAYAGYEPEQGTSVNVRFHDETGKIPLENIDLATLRFVFEQLGFELQDQERLADHLLDWIDEDDLSRISGMDGEEYRRGDPPYNPANRMLRSWDELRLIPPFRELFWDENGVALPILQQLKDSLTWHHTSAVNVNSASPLVRQVFRRMGVLNDVFLERQLAGPDGIAGTEDDMLVRKDLDQYLLSQEGGGSVGMEITVLTVEVEVQRGTGNFLLTAMVSWSGANPSAGRGSGNPTPVDPAPDADTPAERSRSTSAGTSASEGAKLGYPFKIINISENSKI